MLPEQTFDEFTKLLGDQHPQLELTYLGSGYKLDVFRVYWRNTTEEIGQFRCGRKDHILRFDLPQNTPSPCPLVVEEDEDGDSWVVPGWDTIQGFLDSFKEYPIAKDTVSTESVPT